MKGQLFWDRNGWMGGVVVAFFIIVIYTFVVLGSGSITIQVTGQPQIDSLTQQLSVCQEELNIFKQTEQLVCKCSCPSDIGVIFLGFMIGVGATSIIIIFTTWFKNRKKSRKEVKKNGK